MPRTKLRNLEISNPILAGSVTLMGGVLTASASELNQMDGATVDPAELSQLSGDLFGATITVGEETTNAISVGIQLEDFDGAALTFGAAVTAYLSDDDAGAAIAGTAPDGSVVIGTDGLLIPMVANKAFTLVSEADGSIDLTITESAADTWYLVLIMPDGRLIVSDAITFISE